MAQQQAATRLLPSLPLFVAGGKQAFDRLKDACRDHQQRDQNPEPKRLEAGEPRARLPHSQEDTASSHKGEHDSNVDAQYTDFAPVKAPLPGEPSQDAVSYTHLDVYKRQGSAL